MLALLTGLNDVFAFTTVNLESSGPAQSTIGGLLGVVIPLQAQYLDFFVSLVVASALLVFCFREPALRTKSADLTVAVTVGLLVLVGWIVGQWMLSGEAASLTFVLPVGQSLLWFMQGGSPEESFGVSIILGMVIGSALWASYKGRFRLEFFSNGDDMVRNIVGGTLMGVGGTLALGCTIGQGISGVSTLSIGSIVALATILIGAWWGLKFLETGHFLSWIKRKPSS